jgi:tRNA pseudouridine55 synthase
MKASTSDMRRSSVDGVLLLDKPKAISSNAALRSAQRLFGASKAGHTGTLDPLATGLLPVCFGEATKFSQMLLHAEKTYLARVLLGTTTSTGDLEGEVTGRAPVAVGRDELDAVLKHFMGEIVQIPPMYSALKKGGQPLYRLARAGRSIARTPRKVAVSNLSVVGMTGHEIEFLVTCSKGTYIRVLAEDIGRELGCGACLSALRRTAVGRFTLDEGAVTLAHLEALTPQERAALLLPADTMVASLPRFDLDAEQVRRITRGQALDEVAGLTPGLTRIYGPESEFLGLAEAMERGRMVPRRLRSQEVGG